MINSISRQEIYSVIESTRRFKWSHATRNEWYLKFINKILLRMISNKNMTETSPTCKRYHLKTTTQGHSFEHKQLPKKNHCIYYAAQLNPYCKNFNSNNAREHLDYSLHLVLMFPPQRGFFSWETIALTQQFRSRGLAEFEILKPQEPVCFQPLRFAVKLLHLHAAPSVPLSYSF